MGKRLIQPEWEDYLAACKRNGAGPHQIAATQVAFYAGCAAVFFIFTKLPESASEDLADEDLERLVRDIHDELTEFMALQKSAVDANAN